MKKTLVITFCFATVTFGAVSMSQAATPTPYGPVSMDVFDLDGDGVITETEFNTVRAERQAERANSGRLNKNMANAPSFADIDTDGDGVISADELTQNQINRRANRPGRAINQTGNFTPYCSVPMNVFDLNDDGVITAEEFNSAKAEIMASDNRLHRNAPSFEYFDADGDGIISTDELSQAQVELRANRPGLRQRINGTCPGRGYGCGRFNGGARRRN